jgi:hypothetical protein
MATRPASKVATVPLDPLTYAHAPTITVSTGITLATALVDSTPKDAPANVKKAATYLKSVADLARTDLADRNRELGTFPDEDSRVLDNEADRCWGGFRLCLQGRAMLRPDLYPKAKLAAEIDAKLFAQGTEFLKSEYASQSSSMSVLLQTIDDDKMEKDINSVVGPDFLTAIRDVQPRYEAMVKERLRRDNASGQNLTERVRTIQNAIVNYASKVIGSVEHDEPATAEAARVALLPIVNHRDAVAAAQRSAPAPVAAPAVVAEPGAEPKKVEPS